MMQPSNTSVNRTQEHWDSLANDYDQAKQRNDAYYRALKACFASAVPQSARGRILEIGCGTGQILASLRPLSGVGIDLSENMINIAKRQFAGRRELTFAAMDASALSAPTLGEFDAVISADVLEHVDDWQAVVSAMVGACRSEGLVAICTPNPRWAFPLWVLEKIHLKMPEGPHRFVPLRHIAQALRDCGCIIRQQSTHLILPVHWRGMGPRVSQIAENVPLLKSCGVIQMVVAEKAK